MNPADLKTLREACADDSSELLSALVDGLRASFQPQLSTRVLVVISLTKDGPPAVRVLQLSKAKEQFSYYPSLLKRLAHVLSDRFLGALEDEDGNVIATESFSLAPPSSNDTGRKASGVLFRFGPYNVDAFLQATSNMQTGVSIQPGTALEIAENQQNGLLRCPDFLNASMTTVELLRLFSYLSSRQEFLTCPHCVILVHYFFDGVATTPESASERKSSLSFRAAVVTASYALDFLPKTASGLSVALRLVSLRPGRCAVIICKPESVAMDNLGRPVTSFPCRTASDSPFFTPVFGPAYHLLTFGRPDVS